MIDDALVFRLGLRLYVSEAMPGVELVGEAGSVEEGLDLVARARPDLVFLDAALEERRPHTLLLELLRLLPRVRVLLLANLPDSPGLLRALQAGAQAVVLKTAAHECLPAAVGAVLNGETWVSPGLPAAAVAPGDGRLPGAATGLDLTARQRQVMQLVSLGLSNAQIADRLFISEETVKSHISQLLRKMGARTRVQIARYALSRGLDGR